MDGLENLFGRLQALSPNECREIVTACAANAMQAAEAETANKLVRAVLEEHKELSAELAIRRMNNTGSVMKQGYSLSLPGEQELLAKTASTFIKTL